MTEAIIFTDFMHSYYCFAMDWMGNLLHCENTLSHDEQHRWKQKAFPKASNIFHPFMLHTELRYANISATAFPKI